MNLRSFRIGSRLAIAFGLSLASAALLLAIALVSQDASARRQDEAGRRLARGMGTEAALRSALDRTSIAIRDMGLASELDKVQAHQAVANTSRQAYLRILGEVARDEGGGEVGEVVAALRAVDARSAAHYTEVVGLLAAFSTEPAVKLINEKLAPLFAESQALLLRLNTATQRRSELALEEAARNAARMRLWVIGCGALALLATGAMAWAVVASIVRPLGAATRAADEVAHGNLAFAVDTTGRDEPARLLQRLDGMRLALASMVGEVRASADLIAHAAAEIANGNTDLSTRTEQQASSLQLTASTMTELETTVRQTAGNASQASERAQAATRVAAAGGEAVERVVGTMRDIHASSARIADIIGVIDGIAFQTNILALNAAVEAARAGEQGRGFAVVASEVRSLASRSADAARQIKALISTSVDRVDVGSRLVVQAGSTMGEIVEAIRKVSDIASEISAATGEQSAGVSDVGRSVADMDEATQQNAALVEQSAAAAESLRVQAHRLVETVSRFRLQHDASAVAVSA